jgi:pimeloyl-ACP methyl ester carboxylesterase
MPGEEIRFPAGGGECVGCLFRAPGEGVAPGVVLGSGFSCVRDQGLDTAAERLAAAGFTALSFDYRHWGESPGEPRSLMSATRQRQDWRSALGTMHATEGVDRDRVALWGFSLGTGHVQSIAAAGTEGIAALVLVAPLLSGLASLVHMGGPGHAVRLFGAGLRDMARTARGAEPFRVPATGPPGSLGVLNSPDSEPGFAAVTPAGTSWRNEACARAALAPPYRLARKVRRIAQPALYCVFEDDDVNPPELGRRAAEEAPRGELRTYPGGHFAPFQNEVFDRMLDDQVEFLRRQLGSSPAG